MFYTDKNLREVGQSLRRDYIQLRIWYREFINYILAKWYGTKPKNPNNLTVIVDEEAMEEEEILLYQDNKNKYI